jgi:ubiquinol-cytochrome c reductase cytochrome b subunit
MNALLQWIDDRSGLRPALRKCAEHRLPGRACWCKVWPCTILFAFCVQAITGFFLWGYYSPSAQTAWESVYFLQSRVQGGWLLRAMHHYSAHVLLALLIIYVVQTILTRAYRAPRELVFWLAVAMGLCALAAVLTGDLLPWNQNAYAATKTRTGFLTFLPGVGNSLLRLAIGGPGPALGSHTLTRFFALHVGLFAASLLGLLILHGVLARRADTQEAATAAVAVPAWPSQAWRGAVACLVVLAVILLLAGQYGVAGPHAGAGLGSPADTNPANAYNAARPEWFLLGVYEFSHFFSGQWGILPIFVFPGLLLCLVLAMPFIGRSRAGHYFNVAFTVLLVIALVALSYRSIATDAADKQHQKGIADEANLAERVCQLAVGQGIPATGALRLLQDDPKTQGPRLFGQCASCHNYRHGGDEEIVAEKPSAPNLAGFAERRWLAGLLNPKTIVGPDYFGNTKFRGAEMVNFVKENFADIDEAEKKDLERLIIALSGQARLKSQRELDAKDAEIIKAAPKLLDQFGCTDCHRFYDKGSAPVGPELTHYGSREWLIAIIGNPADKRLYGAKNDRMPAYAEEKILTPQQIALLADWLRGQWYEGQQQ